MFPTEATLQAKSVRASRFRPSLVFISFVLLGFLLVPFYRYELGPDGVSYLSIAAQYAAGYWREAVNAYWSPLYSWCVAVFLLVHISPLIAAKIVNFTAGLAALWALRRISCNLKMDKWLSFAMLCMAALMLLPSALVGSTPDVLLTGLLLVYLSVIFDPGYLNSRYGGISCGLLGGLAYLAKEYGFFFFLFHFCVSSAVIWAKGKGHGTRNRIGLQFVSALALFVLISSAWTTALYVKYGRGTLGTAGEFNHRLVGPDSTGYPQQWHLIAPTSEHAVSGWQDPSPSWLPSWSVLQSSATIKHQLKLIFNNTKDILSFLTYTTPLYAAFLIVYVAISLNSSKISLEWVPWLFTIALFSAGYALVTVEARYLYLVDLLYLWVAFRILDLLFKTGNLKASTRGLLISAVALSFVVEPVRGLFENFLADRGLAQWSELAKQAIESPARLASCSHWEDSDHIAYMLGARYYGVFTPTNEADQIARELNPDYHGPIGFDEESSSTPATLSDAHIDYLLVWPDCKAVLPDGIRVANSGGIKLIRLAQNRQNR